MEKDEIVKKVTASVAESLARSTDGINLNSSITGDLGADSLDFLDIMFALERTFKIVLGKEQFDLLKKVGLSKEEAIADQNLTPLALERLHKWLPSLPKAGKIPVRNLRDYITVETVVLIVESLLPGAGT